MASHLERRWHLHTRATSPWWTSSGSRRVSLSWCALLTCFFVGSPRYFVGFSMVKSRSLAIWGISWQLISSLRSNCSASAASWRALPQGFCNSSLTRMAHHASSWLLGSAYCTKHLKILKKGDCEQIRSCVALSLLLLMFNVSSLLYSSFFVFFLLVFLSWVTCAIKLRPSSLDDMVIWPNLSLGSGPAHLS